MKIFHIFLLLLLTLFLILGGVSLWATLTVQPLYVISLIAYSLLSLQIVVYFAVYKIGRSIMQKAIG